MMMAATATAKTGMGALAGMLRHLGNGKKIGATFKFSIPVSLSTPTSVKCLPKKTMNYNNDGLTTITQLQQETKPKKNQEPEWQSRTSMSQDDVIIIDTTSANPVFQVHAKYSEPIP